MKKINLLSLASLFVGYSTAFAEDDKVSKSLSVSIDEVMELMKTEGFWLYITYLGGMLIILFAFIWLMLVILQQIMKLNLTFKGPIILGMLGLLLMYWPAILKLVI